MHPRVLVFADALLEALELADQEVGQRVARERRRAVERVAAVRAEVVDDVARAVAVVDAERDLVLVERHAHGVDELDLVAVERVRVARVDAEIAAGAEEPLRRRVVVDVGDAERAVVGRIDLEVGVVGAVERHHQVVQHPRVDRVVVVHREDRVLPGAAERAGEACCPDRDWPAPTRARSSRVRRSGGCR